MAQSCFGGSFGSSTRKFQTRSSPTNPRKRKIVEIDLVDDEESAQATAMKTQMAARSKRFINTRTACDNTLIGCSTTAYGLPRCTDPSSVRNTSSLDRAADDFAKDLCALEDEAVFLLLSYLILQQGS